MQPYRVFGEASIRISYLEAAVAVPGQVKHGTEVVPSASPTLKTLDQSQGNNGMVESLRVVSRAQEAIRGTAI